MPPCLAWLISFDERIPDEMRLKEKHMFWHVLVTFLRIKRNLTRSRKIISPLNFVALITVREKRIYREVR
jgi:hypothetical protein